jgi:hypothetical protein
MDKILLLTIGKKCNMYGWENVNFAHEIGEKEALEEYLKDKYCCSLIKKEKFDFPYFTDGGFKYEVNTGTWTYTFTAYPYKLILNTKVKAAIQLL